MTRYEAIGCGVYIVDPTAKPGDPDEREAVIYTNHADRSIGDSKALAARIADSLNGSEALVEALEKCDRAIDGSLRSAGQSTAGWLAGRKQMAQAQSAARAAIAKAGVTK